MSRTVYLALALLALVCSVAAHAGHNRGGMPYGWRNKRAVSASTCSAFTCALTSVGSSCSSTVICAIGQYCDGSNTCQLKKALGESCSASTGEKNVCEEGSCVDGVCAHFRDVMPGNPCSADSQCSYFETADGSGSNSGVCSANICSGKKSGETCLANHQCVVGTFCASDSTCKPFSTEGQSCNAASADGVTGCDARFSCVDNTCAKKYSRSEGQTCANTASCSANLYCSSSKVCTKVSATASSAVACDIASPNCPAKEECSCKDYKTAGAVATCNAIVGTYDSMSTIEQAAFACLDANKCGADLSSNATVACIKNSCKKEFCSYFSRNVNEMFSDYPTCMVGRMAESSSFSNFLTSAECLAYAPLPAGSPTAAPSSSGSMVSVSIAALFASAIFLFAF